MTTLTRRKALTTIAAAPAAVAGGSSAIAATDPIFEAVATYKALKEESDRLDSELDIAEGDARKYGNRPTEMIEWRGYDIYTGDLAYYRDELLRSGADAQQIKQEYQDAKRRYREAGLAGREWDKRTGIAPLRRECERAGRALMAAEKRMVKIMPTTPAGAAELVDYAISEFDIGKGPEEPFIALETVAAALRGMGVQS